MRSEPVSNGRASPGRQARLRVGLVNNMPDAAVAPTEHQFGGLLRAAAGERGLDLVLLDFPEIDRHPTVRDKMGPRYRPADDLAGLDLDALVVTGAKPADGPLRQTALWAPFGRLVDQAVALRLPTLWSCLAAHAAVDYLDGIGRRRLPAKRFGVFLCEPAGPHPLLGGISQGWAIPHSRLHDLAETDLEAKGYRVLTRSAVVGVDSFVRTATPGFLFVQGHAEYGARTLVYEYLRDLKLHLQGATPAPPAVPSGLFDAETEAAWLRAAAALIERRVNTFTTASVPSLGADDVTPPWRGFAEGLLANWLRDAVRRRTDALTTVAAG